MAAMMRAYYEGSKDRSQVTKAFPFIVMKIDSYNTKMILKYLCRHGCNCEYKLRMERTIRFD